MWNLIRMFFGKNPNDSQVHCPSCNHSNPLRNFGTWEADGQRGLRGKLSSGHIVFACPKCRKEMKYDSLSGKVSPLT